MSVTRHRDAARTVRSLFPGDGPIPNWIAGRWSPDGGTPFETLDPAVGETICSVVSADAAQVERAVASATVASRDWWASDGHGRARVLRSVADAIRARGDDLGLLDTVDAGRPIRDSRTRDVERAARIFEYWAGVTDRIRGADIPVQPGYANHTVYEPYGVVGAIIPWNYPMTNAATKIAPAIATGNGVVLKPAEESPLSALLLAAIATNAGLPDGLVNVVNGPGEVTGDLIVHHEGVEKIAFTGSTAVGRLIARTAGELLKSVSLELGGKSPTIIFEDADIERAARAVVFSGFNNQGQTCTAGTRILVQRGVLDRFLDAVTVEASRLRVGDPLDPATHIGPVISAAQLARIEGYLDVGTRSGALRIDLAVSSEGLTGGYYVLPTLFTQLDVNDTVAREEIFGPVLSLFAFDDEAEAIQLANDSRYGLAASVWTQDVSRTHRLAHLLQSGLVWINAVHALSPGSPYGGYKQSGIGLEMGLEAIPQLMRVKSVWTAIDPWRSPWSD